MSFTSTPTALERIRTPALQALQPCPRFGPANEITLLDRVTPRDPRAYWRHTESGVELVEHQRFPIEQFRFAMDRLQSGDPVDGMITAGEHTVWTMRAV